MSTEPVTNNSASPLKPTGLSPAEQLDGLHDLVLSTTSPVEDWANRLKTIRDNATEIGLWDSDCERKAQEIAQTNTDRELEQLQKDVTAGRLTDWDSRLLTIRAHARAEYVWSNANEKTAHAIALSGMDGDLSAIDTAKDASSKRLLIDTARTHDRTARSYGVDLFSDCSEGFARERLSWQYRREAVGQLGGAGRALADKDLPMAGYKVGQALESVGNANASLFHGTRLMVTDKNVLTFVAPTLSLAKRLFD